MRSQLRVPRGIEGTAQDVNEGSDALCRQRPPVIAHTVAQEYGILLIGRKGIHHRTEASDIQPDRLLNGFIQNDGQALTTVPFGHEMNEMPCAVNVGNAQWVGFCSSAPS